MEREDYKHLDLPTLQDLACRDTRGLSRVYAIEELARRAVQDQALLPVAVAAVSGGRGWDRVQGGVPVGYMGALALLDAGQAAVTGAIVEAMRSWSTQDQEDLLRWWDGPSRAEIHERLRRQQGTVAPETGA